MLTGADEEADFQSGLPPNGNSINPDRPFTKQVIAKGRPLVSDFRVGRISHKPTVVLGFPVRDEHGSIVTVLACAFIIPIPWMYRWFMRWMASQTVLAERGHA